MYDKKKDSMAISRVMCLPLRQVLVIYLSDALLRRYSVLPPGNGRAALRCRYT